MARVLPLSLTVLALLILPALALLAVPALLAMALPAFAQADAASGTPPPPVDATMPLPPLEERLGTAPFTIVDSADLDGGADVTDETTQGDGGDVVPAPVSSPD